jgi:hypothetical protein
MEAIMIRRATISMLMATSTHQRRTTSRTKEQVVKVEEGDRILSMTSTPSTSDALKRFNT